MLFSTFGWWCIFISRSGSSVGQCRCLWCSSLWGFSDNSSILVFFINPRIIDFLVPLYIGEGKSRLTIAIGCTGGRHRSVYVANRLSAHLKGIVGLTVASEHRELVSA